MHFYCFFFLANKPWCWNIPKKSPWEEHGIWTAYLRPETGRRCLSWPISLAAMEGQLSSSAETPWHKNLPLGRDCRMDSYLNSNAIHELIRNVCMIHDAWHRRKTFADGLIVEGGTLKIRWDSLPTGVLLWRPPPAGQRQLHPRPPAPASLPTGIYNQGNNTLPTTGKSKLIKARRKRTADNSIQRNSPTQCKLQIWEMFSFNYHVLTKSIR